MTSKNCFQRGDFSFKVSECYGPFHFCTPDGGSPVFTPYQHKWKINEPRHEISNNVVCVTSNGSDQPARTRSLIRAFA